MEAIDAISWDCDKCGAENKSKEEFHKHVAEKHLTWGEQNRSVITFEVEESGGWWEQCIWCGEQTETIENYWNHTAANHLRYGLSGAAIGAVLESLSGRAYVVDDGHAGEEVMEEDDDGTGGNQGVEIESPGAVDGGMPEIGNEKADGLVIDVESDGDTDIDTDEVDDIDYSDYDNDGENVEMTEVVLENSEENRLSNESAGVNVHVDGDDDGTGAEMEVIEVVESEPDTGDGGAYHFGVMDEDTVFSICNGCREEFINKEDIEGHYKVTNCRGDETQQFRDTNEAKRSEKKEKLKKSKKKDELKQSKKKNELKQSTTHVGDVAVENFIPLEEVRDDHAIEEEGFLIELNEILERHAVIADKGSLGLENVYQGESITNNGLKLACKFCGEGFRKKYKLQLHVDVVHENMREHRCKDCGYEADRVDALRRHIVKFHRTRQGS